MSTLLLFGTVFALLAIVLTVLWGLQRRQRQALEEVTRQLHRIAVGGTLRGRVELSTDQREIAALVTVANHLLTRAGSATPDSQPAPSAPVSALGDQLHEAVLIHGSRGILYANPQFATLIGAQPGELVGRRLEDLVPPEYAELVGEHIRHRLADEPAAPRYEVDLLGLQGQLARLELSAWPIQHEGHRALLIVGVEVMPTQTVAALAGPGGMRSRARSALMSMPGAVATLDARGKIEYLNPAAIALLGVQSDAATGMSPEQLVASANEPDQKLLAELVQQALTTGSPLNLGRRPLGLGQGVNERLVEVMVAPIPEVIADLASLAAMLPQLLDQLARWLLEQQHAGLLRVDFLAPHNPMPTSDVCQAVHAAVGALAHAGEGSRRAGHALDTAHQHTAHLAPNDTDEADVAADTWSRP